MPQTKKQPVARSSAPRLPKRQLSLVGEPGHEQVVPRQPEPEPPHINQVAIQMQTFVDAPGLVFLCLEIDGKPLFIPARLMTDPPGFVAIQVQPQFVLFMNGTDAEAFHQAQAQLLREAQQAAAVQLWTPDKARRGLIN